MDYELSTLPRSEHLEGLRRAAHLTGSPTKGLAQRLGLGTRASLHEVLEKVDQLTPVERRELSDMMHVLDIGVDRALALEGVLIHDSAFIAARQPLERVPSLRELSARAAGRVHAWQYLTNLCELGQLTATETPAARDKLAAALARKYPDMGEYVDVLAHQLHLLPRIRAHRLTQLRERQQQPASKSQSVELEP